MTDRDFSCCPAYFLGSPAPGGMLHRADALYDPDRGDRALLLTGGPGCGKSTLLKRCASQAVAGGCVAEIFRCAAAPDSLDAVLLPGSGLCIMDATAPHTVTPRYPGLCEQTVDLGRAWDSGRLYQQRESLLALYRQEERLRLHAGRILEAVGQLTDDVYRLDNACCDIEKARKFALHLQEEWENITPMIRRRGRALWRLLSAVTPSGPLVLEQTVPLLCDRVTVLEDDGGACSAVILATLKDQALRKGYDCIISPSPLAPGRKIDHLLIPALSLAVCTSSRVFPLTCGNGRRVHARRFRLHELASVHRQHLRFDRRAIDLLLKDAVTRLRDADSVHTMIEQRYAACTDYTVVEELDQSVLNQIKGWCQKKGEVS